MEEQRDFNMHDYPDEELLPDKHPVWLRLVALVTAVVFTVLIAVPLWKAVKTRLPSAELITNSLLLKEQMDGELLEAIVRIKVIPFETGPTGEITGKQGTGFNVSSEGVIITNHHVVAGARSLTVTFPDGKTYQARSWTGRPDYDLAVIKLEKDGLPAALLNPDTRPKPGETLMVIGHPMDFNQLVVEGKLTEYVYANDMPTALLSIDVPVYPGNSGSPVFNSKGEVVAVIFGSWQQVEDDHERQYGLAIPIREALVLLGEIERP